VNGHVYPEVDSAKLGTYYRQPRLLYQNLGNGKFRDISKLSGPGLTDPRSSRGLAIADLFNDGRLEAVINNLSDFPMLLVNVAKNQYHWLGVQLVGTVSNRDAIGARVTLATPQRTYVNEVRSASSYNPSNDLRIHFGLGTESTLKAISVRRPRGTTETFDPPSRVDQYVTLFEGKGHALPAASSR